MDLPEIEVVGLQASQRFFQHAHGDLFVAAVGADLGHDEGLIALALERLADALFAEAIVVLPCVVEKSHTVIERLGDNLRRSLISFGRAEMIAAESHS